MAPVCGITDTYAQSRITTDLYDNAMPFLFNYALVTSLNMISSETKPK